MVRPLVLDPLGTFSDPRPLAEFRPLEHKILDPPWNGPTNLV